MANAQDRHDITQQFIADAKAIVAEGPMDRPRLDRIKNRLMDIAARQDLWAEDDFPAPTPEEKQNRFFIAHDPDTGLTLYLNVMQPGKKIPPHNHTVFACIAAVEGAEQNTVYERVDDGSVEGKADLKLREEVDLRPGNALAMMPDDIHSVVIDGTEVIRHLHFYGQPLESLDGRISYDLEAGTCQIMDIGAKTKK
ncbi:cysteine dioxygenase family protein [Roseovarius sp. Pro17]|uniref:cysteine dioxygenase family protein n=1 Tax=Roseovarius sp. Pro17 TaxID=3108175 RepID=UPI002D7A29AD|nr:cysteine dioxygenase family protein [Roseovarius sp. Pro17]